MGNQMETNLRKTEYNYGHGYTELRDFNVFIGQNQYFFKFCPLSLIIEAYDVWY